MKQKAAILMVVPLYIFTLLFVAGPLIYMVILSFLRRLRYGASFASSPWTTTPTSLRRST